MIHFLDRPATPQQVQEMLEAYSFLIKIVVDIRRSTLAGGGEMHADAWRCCSSKAASKMTYGVRTGIRQNNRLSSSR